VRVLHGLGAMAKKMNGAEILVKTAKACGVDICFVNGGTTEIPIFAAFDSDPGIKTVLGLFEGVCTGAADGYGRMTGKPAMTLLHHGPGLANGIANLHNAKRACTPLLNIIGDHPSGHRSVDPPLTMDIESLARTVSGWVGVTKSADDISHAVAGALVASLHGRIATLIVPHDHQWTGCRSAGIERPEFTPDPVDAGIIRKAAELLRSGKKTVLILEGGALRSRGLRAADLVRSRAGCDLYTDPFFGLMECGSGFPQIRRIPYYPEAATRALQEYEAVILVGAREPVAFFAHQGTATVFLREDQLKLQLVRGSEDAGEALESLAAELGCRHGAPPSANASSGCRRPSLPSGTLTARKACAVIAALQPEHAVVVDEGITTTPGYYSFSPHLPHHTVMRLTGGALGYGIPCAAGAALASPDRPVINLQADGAAAYTVQALWTLARESLNVTTVICSNRRYNSLKLELARTGAHSRGSATLSLVELDNPFIDWVKIASGLGVPATVVDTAEGLASEYSRALSDSGPHVIEVLL
jgi:acetolactate synthase I/II/III large subunit